MHRCPNCREFLRDLYLEICPFCGVEILNHETNISLFKKKDLFETGKFDPENVWLLTDPVAKAKFQFEGKLIELEQDIKFNVMQGKCWQEDDIEYLSEIKRLIGKRKIKKTTSFWFSSPFTPIYRAIQDGKIIISGKKYRFKKGEEIVWQCQMGRELHNLDGPILISGFSPKKRTMFCKEMENAIKGTGMMIKK